MSKKPGTFDEAIALLDMESSTYEQFVRDSGRKDGKNCYRVAKLFRSAIKVLRACGKADITTWQSCDGEGFRIVDDFDIARKIIAARRIAEKGREK